MKFFKLVFLSLALVAISSTGSYAQNQNESAKSDPELPRYAIAYTKTKDGLMRILIDRQENKYYRLDLDRDDRVVSDVLVDKAAQTVSAIIKEKRVTVNLINEEPNPSFAQEKGDLIRRKQEALEDPNSLVNRDIISRLLSKNGDQVHGEDSSQE